MRRPSRLLPRGRWPAVLVLLVVAQWAAVAWVAASAEHAGWRYGDPAETGTLHAAAWAVLHGHLPADGGGFLWPLLTAPFAAAGSAPSSGLAALVLVQVVLLLPLALLAIVGAVELVGGRTLASVAGVVWIALPLLGYRYFDFRMKPPLLDRFLPQALGLAESTVFPAMVALAVAVYLLARALRSGSLGAGVATGLAASAALALSIPSFFFVPGALAALALRRRWAALGAAAAAAVPGLVAAALWHAHAPDAGAPLLQWNWGQFHANLLGFREYFWSLRVVEWLAIAGTIALLRCSIPLAVAAAAWFWPTVLLRGALAYTFSTADPYHPSAVFLGMLLTAYPAFVLLVSALPLLVPRAPGRLVTAPRTG